MKTALILTLALSLGAGKTISAQTTSARVSYDQVMHMDLKFTDETENAEIMNLLPKEAHDPHVLSFDPHAAVYRTDKSKPAQPRTAGAAGEEVQIDIRIQTPEEVWYTDLQTGRVVQQRDLMGKKFLVSDAAEKMSWRMTGRQKTILNYSCQEAVCVRGKDTISAWYTSQIPVSAGPLGWHGLPGLILEGAMGSGGVSMTVTATKVEAVQPDAVALAAPKEGKKVSRKEFEVIQEEKRKEMQEQYGGDGRTIIHIR